MASDVSSSPSGAGQSPLIDSAVNESTTTPQGPGDVSETTAEEMNRLLAQQQAQTNTSTTTEVGPLVEDVNVTLPGPASASLSGPAHSPNLMEQVEAQQKAQQQGEVGSVVDTDVGSASDLKSAASVGSFEAPPRPQDTMSLMQEAMMKAGMTTPEQQLEQAQKLVEQLQKMLKGPFG